jgi:regulator of CtrA degradation
MGQVRGVSASRLSSVGGVTISFGEHFLASDRFDAIFREGMALVERTAAYLDGPGRKEAKALEAPAAMVYANESMRLTTRLLELASWLMIHRARKEGEITETELRKKRARIKLTEPGRIGHVKGFAMLPEGLRSLVVASFALNDRIVRHDAAKHNRELPVQAPAVEPEGPSPVHAQVARLEQAFAAGGQRQARAAGSSRP